MMMRSLPFLLIAGFALVMMAGEADADKEPEWSYATAYIVRTVVISSDGEYIVAGSDDDNVYLFNNNISQNGGESNSGGDSGSNAEETVCQHGDDKTAKDGCNKCICNDGEWLCTEVDCNPDDKDEDDESPLPSVSMIPALISIGLIAIYRRK